MWVVLLTWTYKIYLGWIPDSATLEMRSEHGIGSLDKTTNKLPGSHTFKDEILARKSSDTATSMTQLTIISIVHLARWIFEL